MRHSERDLTPIVDRVARATYARMLDRTEAEEGTQPPSFDELPAGTRTAIKQQIVPLVGDVLAALDALDAEEQERADLDVLAAMESQFGQSGTN